MGQPEEAEANGQIPAVPHQPQYDNNSHPSSVPPQTLPLPVTTTTTVPPPQASSGPLYNSMATDPSYVGGERKLRRILGYGEKSMVETYLLAISPFGLIGAHHFYLRRYHWGILYFFTFGLLGCGYIIDWFRIPFLVKEANDKNSSYGQIGQEQNKKSLSDAYTLWFPFGLLGFHHYYLGNYLRGIVYTVTFGLLGIGWLVDGVRMTYLVKDANKRLVGRQVPEKSLGIAYLLGLPPPLGILGAHNYYLNRVGFGVVYTFTLGLLGVGYVIDWCRMPVLVKRSRAVQKGSESPLKKYVDDAYLLWFPFGLLGFHHFYLGRTGWGFFYFFTFGVLGVGWLIDICRIPFLVRDANDKREQRLLVLPTTYSSNVSSISAMDNVAAGQQTPPPAGGMANPGLYSPTSGQAPPMPVHMPGPLPGPYPSQGAFQNSGQYQQYPGQYQTPGFYPPTAPYPYPPGPGTAAAQFPPMNVPKPPAYSESAEHKPGQTEESPPPYQASNATADADRKEAVELPSKHY